MSILEQIEQALAAARVPRSPVHPFRKQILVCPADMADRIRELIDAEGFSEAYEVQGSAYVPEDRIFLMPSPAELSEGFPAFGMYARPAFSQGGYIESPPKYTGLAP